MTARLGDVVVNEWGEPELTARQEAEAEAIAEDVAREAGCPDERCDELTVCDPCGGFICACHSHGFEPCAEVGIHHLSCSDGCDACVAARALRVHEECSA